MAEIDKLLDNMVAKQIGLAKITAGQPMVLWRGEQQAQGPVLPLAKVFEMIREIAPIQNRTQLADKCQFSFTHKSPTGYFRVEVTRRQNLEVVLRFTAPTLRNTSSLVGIEHWSPTLLWKKDAHHHAVTSVDFSPDSKTLASCSLDGAARLWDTSTGQMERELSAVTSVGSNEASGQKFSIAFSPDGKTVAIGGLSAAYTINIGGSNTNGGLFLGINQMISSVSFSPDGCMIAAASGYKEPLKSEKEEFYEKIEVAVEVIGMFLPGANSPGKAKPDTTGKLAFGEVRARKAHRECALWSDSAMQRFGADLLTVDFLGVNANLSGARAELTHPRATCAAYSPNNQTLACSDNGGNIKFFDTNAKKNIWKSDLLGGKATLNPQSKISFGEPIENIEYDSQGNYLLILSKSCVQWYDLKARRTIWKHGCEAVAACLIGTHGVALLLQVERRIEFLSLRGTPSGIEPLKLEATGISLSISREGKFLACGDTKGNLYVWRLS